MSSARNINGVIKRGKSKAAARVRRQVRGRKRISGTTERPRLVVSRSSRHLFVQVVDDTQGRTLVSASTMEADLRSFDGDKTAKAKKVGELVAERAKARGVASVGFRPRRQQVPRPGRGDRRRRARGGTLPVTPVTHQHTNMNTSEMRTI